MMWTFWSIRNANKEAGHHFFDKGAIEFFDSEFEETVFQGDGGVYFVTSEQFHDGSYSAPRMWTVRKFDTESFRVSTVEPFNKLSTSKEARRLARTLANGDSE